MAVFFIDNENAGLILKSPDGQCWKGSIDNSGGFSFENVDCSLLTQTTDKPVQLEETIQIFPNPTKNKINILKSAKGVCVTKIYNMQGALMMNRALTKEETSISLKKFEPGYYLIKIFSNTHKIILSEKVLKQ